MENMLGLRRVESGVREADDAKPLALSPDGTPPLIEFDSVGYSYTRPENDGDGETLLRDVSFSVPPGSTVRLQHDRGSAIIAFCGHDMSSLAAAWHRWLERLRQVHAAQAAVPLL